MQQESKYQVQYVTPEGFMFCYREFFDVRQAREHKNRNIARLSRKTGVSFIIIEINDNETKEIN
jgi:hypothetical protein